MSVYEQNLQSLFLVNHKLATQLFALKTNERFEVFVDEKDPLNINIANNQNGKVLYENVPIKQTEEYLEGFSNEYQRYPYLYFFGAGNGIFYKALLQDETHKRVVVVEPEMEILYMVLHFVDFTKEIESGRLLLLLARDITFATASEIFMHPESRIFSKTYAFHVLLPFYETEYERYIIAINRMFLQAIEHVIRGLGNDSTDSLIGLQHQIANIDKMLHTPTTTELIRKVKNSEVAVIISTGPSLKKQLPLLKKIKDHATLFCIDSSLPILEKAGIKPDIVISIERVIETAKFYNETSKEFQKDIVYAITSIAHPDLFKEIKSGSLQISMRPFGYTSYFEMPEYGYLGIGMSAANMAYEIIFHANFKTCILIGQDLSYGADGSTHSDGHVYGIKEKGKSQQQRYIVGAYGGAGTVETTLTWKLFKNFFESDIAFGNERGMKTVNATEGGARIEGSIEMPFSEAIEKYVDFNHKKELICLQKPDEPTIQNNLKKADSKIKHMLSYAIKLQKKVEETFLHVAKECEIIESVEENERYEKLDYQNLANVMEEIDTIKEYFDDQEFANIFTDSTQAMILHQEIELAKIQVRNVRTDNEKRQKMIDWVLSHRYWLFSLAGMMHATIDAINMGLEMKIDFGSIEVIRVYLDEKEMDVLQLKGASHVNNIFDIKRLCIDYESAHKERAAFYYSDEQESFRVRIHMPSINDRHFEEFSFKNSLLETTQSRMFGSDLHDVSKKIRVGFLAGQGIEEDQAFIDLIKELYRVFPNLVLQAVCFKEEEKIFIEELFSHEMDKIEFISVKSIYELAEQIDLYIYGVESTKQNKLYALQDILHRYSSVKVPQLEIENGYERGFEEHSEHLKISLDILISQGVKIDVYAPSGKIDEIIHHEKVGNIADVRALCIDYESAQEELKFVYVDDSRGFQADIALPSRTDEGYDLFAFSNSLATTTDKDALRGLYNKGVIGFLGIDENLEDEDFIGSIKELMQKFSTCSFKAFYFNEAQKQKLQKLFEDFSLTTVIAANIADLCSQIEVLYSNYDRNYGQLFESSLVKIIREYSDDLFVQGALLNYKNISVTEYVKLNENYFNRFFENIEELGFEQSDIEKYGRSFHAVFYKKAMQKYAVDLDLDMSRSVCDAYTDWTLSIGLHDHEFLKEYTKFIRAFARMQR
ncbi:DUF115 domain-containing protein [bacterium]|nr:DUF115 domain-containing protein [bacterium]MBU1884200.1 DUF115 domain-containing protein [bacterium]